MAPIETKPSDNPLSEPNGEKKASEIKSEAASNSEPGRPLAPPPKPGEDYFSSNLSLEPNPFEQSFGTGGTVETPGGTKLPSVAALTSPSSLLPGNGNTPFNWGGGSLRTGPLSPAMLSGPANDYFGDTSHTLRGGFTPNESSLRTGLTPGGGGSMFPAPSPNSQALFAQLASGTATPSTIDFHRTAMSAAAAKANHDKPLPQAVTSQPQEPTSSAVKSESKPTSGAFDPHDNDAANGLFMLAQGAQGRNGTQAQYPVGGSQPLHAHPAAPPPNASSNNTNNTSPHMNGNGAPAPPPARGVSEAASGASEDSEPSKPNARGKGKRGSAVVSVVNGRRKAEDTPTKQPANKKTKTASSSNGDMDNSSEDEDDDKANNDGQSKSKMTDEEKRKNFLERNRVAALKCRQRKKQWLANLQNKVEMYSSENDALTAQISQLREEVVNLKTLLLAHKDCPVTQQQGLHGPFMQQTMETYNPQINPYGMAAPIPNQPVMAGQGVQRRFS
ncbi:Aft1 HRA domain-containing protein [Durotheca rogersii]|uniref:Aft1 HRA domain-containing protein n=1 Tax=Durotheca rogersii TaxID=419775 RepID=UPI00221F25D6|nr:Aft1 HRA domain-containing protein [Durotheca rogersii]KAI5859753.1 Aft1 HRA domain-containing protein [Durotheca rogersii]